MGDAGAVAVVGWGMILLAAGALLVHVPWCVLVAPVVAGTWLLGGLAHVVDAHVRKPGRSPGVSLIGIGVRPALEHT